MFLKAVLPVIYKWTCFRCGYEDTPLTKWNCGKCSAPRDESW